MKFKVTEKGVYDAKGKRVDVGAVLEVKGDVIPAWLIGKGRDLDDGKVAVTNPKKAPLVGLNAVHRGAGKYSIMNNEDEAIPGLTKEDAEAFNAMSEEDKAAYIADETKPAV